MTSRPNREWLEAVERLAQAHKECNTMKEDRTQIGQDEERRVLIVDDEENLALNLMNSIESRSGSGAQFIIHLPVAREEYEI